MGAAVLTNKSIQTSYGSWWWMHLGILIVKISIRFFLVAFERSPKHERESFCIVKHDLPSYNCVLCQISVESSVLLLFLYYQFSIACWNSIGLQVSSQLPSAEVLDQFRRQLLAVPFFMEFIIVMCWSKWFTKNDYIFNNMPPTVERCWFKFRQILP